MTILKFVKEHLGPDWTKESLLGFLHENKFLSSVSNKPKAVFAELFDYDEEEDDLIVRNTEATILVAKINEIIAEKQRLAEIEAEKKRKEAEFKQLLDKQLPTFDIWQLKQLVESANSLIQKQESKVFTTSTSETSSVQSDSESPKKRGRKTKKVIVEEVVSDEYEPDGTFEEDYEDIKGSDEHKGFQIESGRLIATATNEKTKLVAPKNKIVEVIDVN